MHFIYEALPPQARHQRVMVMGGTTWSRVKVCIIDSILRGKSVTNLIILFAIFAADEERYGDITANFPCGETTILNSDLFVFSQMGYAINTHSNVTSSFGGTHTPIRNKATELANGCGGGSGGGAGAGRCANGCSGAGVGNYSTARLTPRVKYRGNLIFVNCAKSVKNAPDASATTMQNETQQISG